MGIRCNPNSSNSSLAMADHAQGDSGPVMVVDPKFLLASVFGLFIIVVIVVILHLYTRYVLRRHPSRLIMERQLEGRQLDTAPVHAVASPAPPKRGLDLSIIAALPIFAYRSGGPGGLECSVCLSRMEEEMVRMMPNCKHVFHAECIDKWLHTHTTCPVCRAEVAPPGSPAPATRSGGSSSGVRLEASDRIWSREGNACGGHEALSHDLEGQ